jgi:hypothetical protein
MMLMWMHSIILSTLTCLHYNSLVIPPLSYISVAYASIKSEVLGNLWKQPTHPLCCDAVHRNNWVQFVREPQNLHVKTGHRAGLYGDFA